MKQHLLSQKNIPNTRVQTQIHTHNCNRICSRSRLRTRKRNTQHAVNIKRFNAAGIACDAMHSGSCKKIQKGKPGNMTNMVRTKFVLKHGQVDCDGDLRLKQLELKSEPQKQCGGNEANRFHQSHALAPLEWSPNIAFQQSVISDEDCIEYLNGPADASSDFQDSSDSIKLTSIYLGSKYVQDVSTKLMESWVH